MPSAPCCADARAVKPYPCHAALRLRCRRAVEVVCREGPKLVLELARFGAEFTRGEGGDLHLTREGGHSARRIVHAGTLCGGSAFSACVGGVGTGVLTRTPYSTSSPRVPPPHSFGSLLLTPVLALLAPALTLRLLPSPSTRLHPSTRPPTQPLPAPPSAADATGAEIERALLDTARANPNISFFEHHFATDLVLDEVGLASWRLPCCCRPVAAAPAIFAWL